MKQNQMPEKLCLRNRENLCDGALCYYKEANQANDLYYCNRCYSLAEWDGEEARLVGGEAYPNRTGSR